jgi:hypothetical protein
MVFDRSNGIDWRNGFATKLGVVIALFIAVFAIGWGWNYGLVQERTYEQEARQAHANQAEDGCYQITEAEVQNTSVKKPDSKPCAPDEKAQQENDNRRDYADLVAQRSSALWAKIMGIAALIGMGLSLIGVALVWTTFRETRRANQISSATTEAENRAWIKVSVQLTSLHVYPDAIQMENLQVIIENVGFSVARQIVCWASFHVQHSGFMRIGKLDDIPDPQFIKSDRLLNLWHGQKETVLRRGHGLGPNPHDLPSETFEVFMRVVVKYETIFSPEKTRMTELIIRLIDNRGGPFSTAHIPHNGVMIYQVREHEDGSGGGLIT